MPWWAIIYLGIYAASILVGIAWHFHKFYLGAGTVSEWLRDIPTPIIWSYFFAAFWFHQLSSVLGLVSPVMILGAITWDIYCWPNDVRETNLDKELTRVEKWSVKSFVLIMQLPAYVIATIAALRDYIHF